MGDGEGAGVGDGGTEVSRAGVSGIKTGSGANRYNNLVSRSHMVSVFGFSSCICLSFKGRAGAGRMGDKRGLEVEARDRRMGKTGLRGK